MTTDDADLAEERATSDCCGAAICFSLEHDNFYCVRCNRGQGCAFYDKHQANWRDFPAGNRDKPAAVPASPQAETRGDLLERMAGALREAIVTADEYNRLPLESMVEEWEALLAEYAESPVQQGDENK